MNLLGNTLADVICRPQKHSTYDLGSDLFELKRTRSFGFGTVVVRRFDTEMKNNAGQKLQCSHYVPSSQKGDHTLCSRAFPTVIYCHGSGSSRSEGNPIVDFLLPRGIAVFSFDFSGAGMSEGSSSSMGYREQDDLRSVVNFLAAHPSVDGLGVWGRSMGAAAALMVAQDCCHLDAVVADSSFLSLEQAVTEWAGSRIGFDSVPGLSYFSLHVLRHLVRDREGFDISEVAPSKSILAGGRSPPVLFGAALHDEVVGCHHSQELYNLHMQRHGENADCHLANFSGTHNSARPSEFMEQASDFLVQRLRRRRRTRTRTRTSVCIIALCAIILLLTLLLHSCAVGKPGRSSLPPSLVALQLATCRVACSWHPAACPREERPPDSWRDWWTIAFVNA